MTPEAISITIIALGSLFYFYKRSLRYLKYFQQEEYESGRFIEWYKAKRAFDTNTTKLLVVPLIISFIPFPFANYVAALLTLVVFAYIVLSEEDPKSEGKKVLKMTERAKRIHLLGFVYFLVFVIAAEIIALHFGGQQAFIIAQLVFVQLVPFCLVLSNIALDPYEKSLQEGFANQAREILKEVDPTVIGITGSYGKTSTKILLKDILSSVYSTFSTPGSVNTYMGVTRKIREEMNSSHKFAVIEMGAYYEGSIKKMCSLTPPKAAIVTTVGLAHLERFGSQETIYRAKSELPQAVPDDGILVVNGDNEYTRRMAEEFKKKTTLIYGLDPDKGHLDALMYDLTYTEEGTSFKIKWRNQEFEGFTRLLGKPMLENVLAAFTMACAVGVPADVALAAIRNAKAESNRLELVKADIGGMVATNGKPPRPGKMIRLNDAYNSNPVGFAAALEVLSAMPGGRKILVTPGMVELGEEQHEKNAEAAKVAASVCDLVLVVGDTNKKALVEGLEAGGMKTENFKEFPLMKDALKYLATNYCDSGDVLLIENDLPDLYEGEVRF